METIHTQVKTTIKNLKAKCYTKSCFVAPLGINKIHYERSCHLTQIVWVSV